MWGQGGNEGGASKQQIKIVGSSTVYPFTKAVAEISSAPIPDVSVIVESTGTGAGIKLFCAGVGGELPGHRERLARR